MGGRGTRVFHRGSDFWTGFAAIWASIDFTALTGGGRFVAVAFEGALGGELHAERISTNPTVLKNPILAPSRGWDGFRLVIKGHLPLPLFVRGACSGFSRT